MPHQLIQAHLPISFPAVLVPLAPAPTARIHTPHVLPLNLISNVGSVLHALVLRVLSNTRKAVYCRRHSTAAYLQVGRW